jgi:hypothetical protein
MQFTFTSINISVCFVNLKIFGMFFCRLTNVFKECKPHFVRVAAYIVADLLRYFETYTLYPEVKVSGCAHAINYCDGFKISLDESQNSSHIGQQIWYSNVEVL